MSWRDRRPIVPLPSLDTHPIPRAIWERASGDGSHAPAIAHPLDGSPMAPSPIRVSIEEEFPLSVTQTWELLGNTEHLNRTISLPAVTYGNPQVDAGDFYRSASARVYGISLTWKEYPFEWVRNQRYSVLRVYEKGPVHRVWGGIELEPAGAGCRVRVFADITPRRGWALLRPLLRAYGRKSVRKVLAYCHRHMALREERPDDPLPRQLPQGVHAKPLHRLADKVVAETNALPEVMERLTELIEHGSDEEVLHMRPYALAHRWGMDRVEVLRCFLYGTVGGLLELDWELMCPNCRVPKAGFRGLSELTSRFHCDLCGTDYQADLDRVTELRFSVHPTLRKAEDAIYCISGPMNTPHILSQRNLPPGESHETTIELANEALRARVLRHNHTTALTPDPGGSADLELVYTDGGWMADQLAYQPGLVKLRWRNASDAVQIAVIEKLEWDDFAVTAARVMAMREFRTLFSSEVLDPGREIGIRNLCVLFTDLKRSTQLYEKVGDASAFGHVRRHFDFLIECFERHEGGIVKTIGDAVMASFPSPTQALRAALEVQTAIDAFNDTLSLEDNIVIKIGLHNGAAIAVNANGQMDYFGRMVNIAARIQGLSEGGDIVMSRHLFEEPDIQAVLQDAPFEAELFGAPLRGIEAEMALCRLKRRDRPLVRPQQALRVFHY